MIKCIKSLSRKGINLEYIIYILYQILFVPRNPLAQMEEEKREHDLKMKKMESEMEQVCIKAMFTKLL